MSQTMRAAPSTARMNPPGRPKSRRPTRPPRSEPPMPTAIVIGMLIGLGPGMTRRPSAPMMRPLRMSSRMKPNRPTVPPLLPRRTTQATPPSCTASRQVLGGDGLEVVGRLEPQHPAVEPQLGLDGPHDALGLPEAVLLALDRHVGERQAPQAQGVDHHLGPR